MEENKILEKIKTAFSHAAAPSADGKEVGEVLDTCRAYESEKKKLRFRHAFRVVAAVFAVFVGFSVGFGLVWLHISTRYSGVAGLSSSGEDEVTFANTGEDEEDETTGTEERAEEAYVVAAAKYPTMASYESAYNTWTIQADRRREEQENYPDGYSDYVISTMRQVLAQETENGTENPVYSPLSIYMALTLLAEATDGNSRAQILDAMGVADIDALRTGSSALWTGNYYDTGSINSILAGSLWLNESISFHQDTLNSLAKNYGISTYQGSMASDDFQDAMVSWLNLFTGNMLSSLNGSAEAARRELDISDSTACAIFSTIYYEVKWEEEFEEEDTSVGTFHAADGDITCEFMNQKTAYESYYRGAHYGAVFKNFEGGGGMWLILPDEDSSVDELLQDEEAAAMLADGLTWSSSSGYAEANWEDYTRVSINLSIPKFDVETAFDLADTLRSFGITDIYDASVADFSPLTDTTGLTLSKARHAVRVAVDEEGVTAAAYTETVIKLAGKDYPQGDAIDFVLDRPFLFAVVSDTGTISFVGVVNRP
ncbi:MAG: hypothetical protein LUE29_10345 [Lachnospiraceae bacterium]|nr:hypothetical protein [Lachnospiraceae bacterium]